MKIPIDDLGPGCWVDVFSGDTDGAGQLGVTVGLFNSALDTSAYLALSRREALRVAAALQEKAEAIPPEPRPAVWVGDLRELPKGTGPASFWHGWSPDEDGPFLAVCVGGNLTAVLRESDRELLWHVCGASGVERVVDVRDNDPVIHYALVASDEAEGER